MSAQQPTPPPPQPPLVIGEAHEPGPPVGRIVLGVVLLLVGLLWLLDAVGAVGLRWGVVLPAALTVVGVALLATARRGAHGGLVAAGIVLSVLVLSASLVPVTTTVAGVGERDVQPSSAAEAEAGYELGMGSVTVDLTGTDGLRDGLTVPVRVGIGEVVVVLPEGVGAQVEANVGIGEVEILDRSQGGFGVSVSEEIDGEPRLRLELDAGIGRVEVRR